MFQVIGDDVEFEGWPVFTLRGDIPANVRERMEHVMMMADDIDQRERADELANELDETRTQYTVAAEQRDAYAAILGVTPDNSEE